MGQRTRTLKDRPGKAFETLVAQLEHVLGHGEGRTVEYDKRLPHLRGGRPRQFDVVVTQGVEHHRTITAIECKDLSRPVDAPAVEQFAKKVEGCAVSRGIMVASRGFTADARLIAADSKIALLTLQEAESFAWAIDGPHLPVAGQVVDHINIHIVLDPDQSDIADLFGKGAKFVDEAGVELDAAALGQICGPQIQWDRLTAGGPAGVFPLVDPDPTAYLLMPDETRVPIRLIVMQVTARITLHLMEVARDTYITPDRAINVLSGDTEMDGRPIKLMVLSEGDGVVRVGIAPRLESSGPLMAVLAKPNSG